MTRRKHTARMLPLLGLAACLLATPAWAEPPRSLTEQADGVIARLAPASAHVGVSVVDIATGETLYARDAAKLFTPASLAKLTTSGAALAFLGAQRKFTTKLLADGGVENGMVRGSLYLKGEGDPSLTVADLDAMAKDLREQGIKTIVGDVVADATYFAPESAGAPGWPWDDLTEDYGAPVSALALSHDVATVEAAPGPTPGENARVTLRPMSGFVDVKSRVTTGVPGSKARVDLVVSRPTPWQEVWTLTGTVPVGGQPVPVARAIAEPARMAAFAMKEALARQGVAVHGSLKLAATPASARTVATHQSAPLGELIRAMNKESDNLFAETMLFHVGVRGQGTPGTREKGVRTVKAFLERLGWPAGGFRLEDGSGLSRYDAVTPAQLTQLLCAMPKEALAYPAYLISLPVAGVDGTLATRLTDPAVRGRLRAKTGTMSGVSGLAGYMTTDSGRTVAIAVLVNGFIGSAADARRMQDALVGAIAAGDAEPVSQR